MIATQATLANVRAGRGAMFMQPEEVYREAMRRLAMDDRTPQAWIERAVAASENLAAATDDDREPATAAFLARARELFGEVRA